jgi:hypothetical protein
MLVGLEHCETPWLVTVPCDTPNFPTDLVERLAAAAQAEDAEIARIMDVPLADVLAADLLIPARPDIATLRYSLLGEDVWGLTARILRTFSEVVHRLAPAGERG